MIMVDGETTMKKISSYILVFIGILLLGSSIITAENKQSSTEQTNKPKTIKYRKHGHEHPGSTKVRNCQDYILPVLREYRANFTNECKAGVRDRHGKYHKRYCRKNVRKRLGCPTHGNPNRKVIDKRNKPGYVGIAQSTFVTILKKKA